MFHNEFILNVLNQRLNLVGKTNPMLTETLNLTLKSKCN